MIQTFSWGLFTHSALGVVAVLASVAAIVIGALLALKPLAKLTRFDERAAFAQKLMSAMSFVSIIALVLLWLIKGPLGFGGEFTSFSVRGHGESQDVRVVQFFYGKSGRQDHLYVFNSEGERLGHENRSYSIFAGGRFKTVWVGERGVELVHRGESYVFVDGDTRAPLNALNALLDARLKGASYRVDTIKDGIVEVEHSDGRRESFVLDELAPKRAAALPGVQPGLWRATPPCEVRISTKKEKEGERVGALLRAVAFTLNGRPDARVCTISGLTLFVHRSTAFGEGDYLLSAFSEGKLRWTTPLAPFLGGGLLAPLGASLRFVGPEQVGADKLCMWLIRDKRSLTRMCVGSEDGKALSAKVIF